MRVAIYARVSTSDQNAETQLVALRDYCRRMGYEIAQEFVDRGFSGATDKRPAFHQLLGVVRSGAVEGVVLYKLDRIYRSLIDLLNLVQELQHRKIKLISVSENIDPETPMGKAFMHILGAFGEMERSVIVERTMAGLERARREGKRLGRPKGSKDRGRRRKSGYLQRWAGNGSSKKSPSHLLVSA